MPMLTTTAIWTWWSDGRYPARLVPLKTLCFPAISLGVCSMLLRLWGVGSGNDMLPD